MARRQSYTDEDHRRVRELAREHSGSQIERMLGIPFATMACWAKTEGYAFQAERVIYSSEERAEARQKAKRCSSWQQLSRMTGISYTTLRRWSMDEGWGIGGSNGRASVFHGRAVGCERCTHPDRDKCSQYWCACEVNRDWTPPEKASEPIGIPLGLLFGHLVLGEI